MPPPETSLFLDLLGWSPLVLLAAWAALLFGGFVLGRPAAASERRMARWPRLASSFALVLAAWPFALLIPGRERGILLIAIGMTLGFAGDLFMAGVIPVGNHVLGGMAAFALGHIAYIAAGLSLGNIFGLSAPAPRALALVAGWFIGLLGWYFVVFRGQKKHNVLDWVALPYALLLASTVGVFTGLALQTPAFIPTALGAVLFLFSDLMIAAKLFAGRETRGINIDDLVWLTYGPGQMLIVYTPLWLILLGL